MAQGNYGMGDPSGRRGPVLTCAPLGAPRTCRCGSTPRSAAAAAPPAPGAAPAPPAPPPAGAPAPPWFPHRGAGWTGELWGRRRGGGGGEVLMERPAQGPWGRGPHRGDTGGCSIYTGATTAGHQVLEKSGQLEKTKIVLFLW